MSEPNRCTLFIEEDPFFGHAAHATEPARSSQENRPLQQAARQRFPVKRSHGEILVPVVTGSPWKHYENRYRVKYWCSFGTITRRDKSVEPYMIRTISGSKSEEQIQTIRQLCHPNLVDGIEIYAGPQSSHFILSEFMPTSLLHICRSPMYPTEPQLGSILHQVLSGVEYLISCGLMHEDISCAAIFIGFAGEVKISDVEHSKEGGDFNKLLDSFSRMIMILMDKEKNTAATVGLSRPESWSPEALDMFTTSISQPSLKDLLGHSFFKKRSQEELKWLVPFVLITANHSRE